MAERLHRELAPQVERSTLHFSQEQVHGELIAPLGPWPTALLLSTVMSFKASAPGCVSPRRPKDLRPSLLRAQSCAEKGEVQGTSSLRPVAQLARSCDRRSVVSGLADFMLPMCHWTHFQSFPLRTLWGAVILLPRSPSFLHHVASPGMLRCLWRRSHVLEIHLQGQEL